jgi:hypothetical protein
MSSGPCMCGDPMCRRCFPNPKREMAEMLTFVQFAEQQGIELVPDSPPDGFTGAWFQERHLPMIVACTVCEMTMCIMSGTVRIDSTYPHKAYCKSCAGV